MARVCKITTSEIYTKDEIPNFIRNCPPYCVTGTPEEIGQLITEALKNNDISGEKGHCETSALERDGKIIMVMEIEIILANEE